MPCPSHSEYLAANVLWVRKLSVCDRWLGQNSKQNKLSRQLTDVQARMRLKVSGDKSEIRQSYIPSLFPHIVQPLMEQGAVSPLNMTSRFTVGSCRLLQSAVDETIEFMDEYFLTREDWDTIVELGVGDNVDTHVLKKISTATKTSFTKKYVLCSVLCRHPTVRYLAESLRSCTRTHTRVHRYNSRDHPVAFHKAELLGKAPKKIAAAGPAPDLEEAFDVSVFCLFMLACSGGSCLCRLMTKFLRPRRKRKTMPMTMPRRTRSSRRRRGKERGRRPKERQPRMRRVRRRGRVDTPSFLDATRS